MVMAEGVGFEPTRTFALPVFKTGAINRSTTPPKIQASLILAFGRDGTRVDVSEPKVRPIGCLIISLVRTRKRRRS